MPPLRRKPAFVAMLKLIIHRCTIILQCVATIVMMLFAFVPIICLFTWMIPLFVLERIVPIQFYAFILNIPLIIWCTMISTVLVTITFCISYFIDKQNVSKSMSQNLCKYIWYDIKSNVSVPYAFAAICQVFGILVLSSFCSFVFCVSPALYLCAMFWFIYEIQRESDVNHKENRLEIRQYLYQHIFGIFDDIQSRFKRPNRLISRNIADMKQFVYHLFSLLLCMKRINSEDEVHPSLIKDYLKCLQNNCKSCNHQWTVKYSNIRDFRSFVCMKIGASLLMISHLSLFWFWTLYNSENVVGNITIDFNSMTTYSQLLIYYMIEHSCIIIVFVTAAKIYFDDIIKYHAFEFFNFNQDSQCLFETLDGYKIPDDVDDDIFITTYCKLLHVYLEQLITKQTMKVCIKDEWLQNLLCVFCCGDKQFNILYDKRMIDLLDKCMILSDEHNMDTSELLIPIQDENKVDTFADWETEPQKATLKSLLDFRMYFNANINGLPSYIQCSKKEIKQLIVDYVNFCAKK